MTFEFQAAARADNGRQILRRTSSSAGSESVCRAQVLIPTTAARILVADQPPAANLKGDRREGHEASPESAWMATSEAEMSPASSSHQLHSPKAVFSPQKAGISLSVSTAISPSSSGFLVPRTPASTETAHSGSQSSAARVQSPRRLSTRSQSSGALGSPRTPLESSRSQVSLCIANPEQGTVTPPRSARRLSKNLSAAQLLGPFKAGCAPGKLTEVLQEFGYLRDAGPDLESQRPAQLSAKPHPRSPSRGSSPRAAGRTSPRRSLGLRLASPTAAGVGKGPASKDPSDSETQELTPRTQTLKRMPSWVRTGSCYVPDNTPRRLERVLSPQRHAKGLDSVDPSVGVLPPVGHILQFPYWSVGHDDINEKYIVMWDERLHIGGLNGLNVDSAGGPGVSFVVKAMTRRNRALRAVKIIRKEHILFPKFFRSQHAVMQQVDHPCICKAVDSYEDSQYIYQVMEPLAGPSLFEKVVADPHYCERDAAAAFRCVLEALACLHGEHKVVYQNLHPENLRFVTWPKRGAGGSAYDQGLKLVDLGLSIHKKHLASVLHATGTDDLLPLPALPLVGCRASAGSGCVPPELRGQDGESFSSLVLGVAGIKEGKRLTPKEMNDVHALLEAGDMWAAGCILHLLLTGCMPPDDDSELPLPPGVHRSARELCASLLRKNPRDRPSATSALKSNWFFHCELLKQGHTSVANIIRASVVTPATPLPEEVKTLMHQHVVACRLRKLVLKSNTTLVRLATRRVSVPENSGASRTGAEVEAVPVVPVRPSGESQPEADVKAMHFMLSYVYESLLSLVDPSSTCVPSADFRRVVSIAEGGRNLPWCNLTASLDKFAAGQNWDDGISFTAFCHFIQEVCFVDEVQPPPGA